MARLLFPILVAFVFAGAAIAAEERHIVVVVWDGMRPDFVSEQNTPTLWKLAQSGVTFQNNHAVFPSATIVNGTAIATGAYPDRSGILANRDYRPEIDAKKSIDVENTAVVGKGDQLTGGNYLNVPTIAELIRDRGGKTAIASSKTVGLLLDRSATGRIRRGEQGGSGAENIFAGESLPPNAVAAIVKTLGTFSPASQPAARDTWTTKALTDYLWHDQVPAFSLLWLSEPDDTEHKTAPGAPAAIAAIKSSDENLGRVLAALDRHRARESTDVFVVSDHGFSTIEHEINLPKILKDAEFDAVTEFVREPKTGQIMLVGNGGTVLFYVIGHDAAVTRRLVEFLQQTDFAGVIFTREPMDGTFTFDKAKIDPPSPNASPARTSDVTGPHLLNASPMPVRLAPRTAPDVEMSFCWNEKKNQFGVPGMIDADWQRAAGKGTHATLSKFDMHNTLIAAGPDFKNGLTSDLVSGNVDLAPTILTILGIKSSSPSMDGRVLSEAMKNGQSLKAGTQTIEATKEFPAGMWRQHLTISRIGSTIYFDEGNGGFQR